MIYRLTDDSTNYLMLDITHDELASKMGENIHLYFGTLINGAAKHWVKPDIMFVREDERQKTFDIPDITLWTSNLVLNSKAYEALKTVLDPFGEFLPLNCEGIDYYLFNVLSFDSDLDALDGAGSEWAIFDGVKSHLNKLAFKEEQLGDTLLFRSEFEGYNRIFCNTKFKRFVETADLKGLRFRTDLEGYI